LGEAFWFPAGRRNFGQAVENLAVRRPLHDFLTNHAQPREQQNESNEGTEPQPKTEFGVSPDSGASMTFKAKYGPVPHRRPHRLHCAEWAGHLWSLNRPLAREEPFLASSTDSVQLGIRHSFDWHLAAYEDADERRLCRLRNRLGSPPAMQHRLR
jgi:hypothetical protein